MKSRPLFTKEPYHEVSLQAPLAAKQDDSYSTSNCPSWVPDARGRPSDASPTSSPACTSYSTSI